MLSLILWAGCLLAGQVESPAAEDLGQKVATLVRQLNSEELTKRDMAEKALVELGPDALSLLPTDTDRLPAEVVQRLARVRQALQQARASASAQASSVTLRADEMPLSEVLAEITKQTGNKIVDNRPDFGEEVVDPKVKVNFDKTPFWQALDEVLDQAGLTVYGFAGERGVYLVSRPEGQLPRKETGTYSGPFRLEPTRLEAVRDLQNPANESLKLFTEVAWEPRLTPIAISQQFDQMKIEGSGGAALSVDDEESEPSVEVGEEMGTVELMIPMALPERKVEKIESLKGKLAALVPGQVETFRFEQLPILKPGEVEAKRIEKRKAGVTVIVDHVRKNNSIWEVRLRIRFDDPNQALESHRTWVFNNEVYMVGADKKQVTPGAFEQTRQTADEIGIKYLFNLKQGPKGMALVYKTPAAILEVPIEYELKNIKLP